MVSEQRIDPKPKFFFVDFVVLDQRFGRLDLRLKFLLILVRLLINNLCVLGDSVEFQVTANQETQGTYTCNVSALLGFNVEGHLHLQSSDQPGLILVSNLLTRKNYFGWSRAMRITLGAKMKGTGASFKLLRQDLHHFIQVWHDLLMLFYFVSSIFLIRCTIFSQ
ncbi:hypothetical protein Scep_026361 [Stephania cephalantha]|uniref:Retrotransposon Copia-like N-terminal domain-containing protein n=1 Tax=Stephania cephalantha TaxID=152367 RepID=A0AAP0EQA1_9MAGN